MAAKAGYPRKRLGNIPADIRGVQVRLDRIAEHAKRNHHLGRAGYNPAFFPCAGADKVLKTMHSYEKGKKK